MSNESNSSQTQKEQEREARKQKQKKLLEEWQKKQQEAEANEGTVSKVIRKAGEWWDKTMTYDGRVKK